MSIFNQFSHRSVHQIKCYSKFTFLLDIRLLVLPLSHSHIVIKCDLFSSFLHSTHCFKFMSSCHFFPCCVNFSLFFIILFLHRARKAISSFLNTHPPIFLKSYFFWLNQKNSRVDGWERQREREIESHK